MSANELPTNGSLVTGSTVLAVCSIDRLGPADRRLIEIAVGNLLDNAIRFSVELGRIAVTVDSQEGVALLHVSDQGPGIEKEHLPHIFERFYSANVSRSRDEGGAGLGLSLVQAIARLHGGTVTVRSATREGSVFSLRLPLHPAS